MGGVIEGRGLEETTELAWDLQAPAFYFPLPILQVGVQALLVLTPPLLQVRSRSFAEVRPRPLGREGGWSRPLPVSAEVKQKAS